MGCLSTPPALPLGARLAACSVWARRGLEGPPQCVCSRRLGKPMPGAAGTALFSVNQQMSQRESTCSPSWPRPSLVLGRGPTFRRHGPALLCCLLKCGNSSPLAKSFCPEPPVRTSIPCAQTLGPPPDPARGKFPVRQGPPGPSQGSCRLTRSLVLQLFIHLHINPARCHDFDSSSPSPPHRKCVPNSG